MVTELTIHVPLISAFVKIFSQPAHTIQDIIEEVARGVSKNISGITFQELVQYFGIFQIDSVVKSSDHVLVNVPPLDYDKKISSLEITKNNSLVFDKIYYRVPLILNDNEQFVTLKGYKTIHLILTELFPVDKNSYEMKLITANQINPVNGIGLGLRMDLNRTLNSYRIKDGDKLQVSTIVSQTAVYQSFGGDSQIVVIISCPNNGICKTMKFPPSSDVRTVKHTFFFKGKLFVAPILFGVYLPLPSNKNNINNINNNNSKRSNSGNKINMNNILEYNNENEELIVDERRALSSLSLPTPARFSCKYIERKPTKLFGVDPTTLPLVNDMGCDVPEVLVILKQLLEVQDGLIAEGIFRKAGSEIEMKYLKEKLENGENVVGLNIHSIATVIKRWFKELPQRILMTVNVNLLIGSQEARLNVFTVLSPFYSSLLRWLFRLIAIPTLHHSSSLMDTKNISIIWGPIMVGTNEKAQIGDDFAAGFQETRHGIDVIETNLTHMLNSDSFVYVNEITAFGALNNSSSNLFVNSGNIIINSNNNNNNNNNNNINNNNDKQLRRSVSAPRQQISLIKTVPQTMSSGNFTTDNIINNDIDQDDYGNNNNNVQKDDEVILRKSKRKKPSKHNLNITRNV